MNRLLSLILITTGLLLLDSCQLRQFQRVHYSAVRPLPQSLPDSLWVSENLSNRMDSLKSYYRDAQRKLSEQDTMGAQIYFDQAYEQLSELSNEDRNTLTYWTEYDTLIRNMDREYQQLYPENQAEQEAEEVREDIAKFEEMNLPDSVLYGQGTVIDSSGPIPITINKKVRLAIKYFQTKGRRIFTKWLKRSGRYETLLKPILKEEGVPEDLFYLAMIESGFQPRARSYARAVGIWQFISSTGRHYGLRHNWWFDERSDVLKSTHAAAKHLKSLYRRFGDWYLALAGYNCNPRKVEYNIRRYRSRNFWKLRRLPRQTRNYIPTFLAALIISKNPNKFGFYVEKDDPITVDSIKISEAVDLNVIAKLVDTTYSYIREINPAVLRWVTPPGIKDFTLYLPKGKKERFVREYAKIPDNKKRSWVRHRIRSGETLSTIARRYHTSMAVIRSINKLRGSFIRAGHYLLIPVPQNKAYYYAHRSRKSTSRRRTSRKRKYYAYHAPGAKRVVYQVKPGDTIGEIAEKFHTRASKIRAWNGLRYGEFIYPKQNLVIWVNKQVGSPQQNMVSAQDDNATYYTVKTGDTLWDISKKYGLTIEKLKRLNNMRSVRIRPGDRIKVSEN